MKEFWKAIPNYPNYMVSNLGRVKHLATTLSRTINGVKWDYHKAELILKPATSRAGQKYLNLYNSNGFKRFVLSHLVAELFLTNTELYDTLIHIDGDPANNKMCNLKWVGEKLFLEGEEWRPLVDGEKYYEVSNLGRVKSIKYNGDNMPHILKTRVNAYGYPYVCIWLNGKRKMRTVHRMVAEAFIPNPHNKPNVNHIDFNPLNSHSDNLEWCTQVENIQWTIQAGRFPHKGERSSSSILSDRQVLEIIDLLKDGKVFIKDIANIYGVSHGTISAINNGKNWRHISNSDRYPIRLYFYNTTKFSVSKLDLKHG